MKRSLFLLVLLSIGIESCNQCYECTLTTPAGKITQEVCGKSNKDAIEESGETCTAK